MKLLLTIIALVLVPSCIPPDLEPLTADTTFATNDAQTERDLRTAVAQVQRLVPYALTVERVTSEPFDSEVWVVSWKPPGSEMLPGVAICDQYAAYTWAPIREIWLGECKTTVEHHLSVTLHEFGHALGMWHSADPRDVMYSSEGLGPDAPKRGERPTAYTVNDLAQLKSLYTGVTAQ